MDVIDVESNEIQNTDSSVIKETQGVKYIDPEYAEKVIQNDIEKKRDKVLFLVLLDTGVRVGELVTLRVRHIDFDEGFLLVHTLKREKEKSRKIPLSKRLQNILPFYTANMNQEKKIFDISTQRVRQITKKYFPKKVSPHTFRHTFAYRYMKNGGDLYDLSRILGHAHITNTEIYADISPQDLKEKYEDVMNI